MCEEKGSGKGLPSLVKVNLFLSKNSIPCVLMNYHYVCTSQHNF